MFTMFQDENSTDDLKEENSEIEDYHFLIQKVKKSTKFGCNVSLKIDNRNNANTSDQQIKNVDYQELKWQEIWIRHDNTSYWIKNEPFELIETKLQPLPVCQIEQKKLCASTSCKLEDCNETLSDELSGTNLLSECQCNDKLRTAYWDIARLKQTNALLKRQNVEYAAKLQQQLDESEKVMQAYDEELKAKADLIELYKKNCVDYQAQVNELEAGIVELIRMLNEAPNQCEIFETTPSESASFHRTESAVWSQQIGKLEEELAAVNLLLNSQKLEHDSLSERTSKLVADLESSQKRCKLLENDYEKLKSWVNENSSNYQPKIDMNVPFASVEANEVEPDLQNQKLQADDLVAKIQGASSETGSTCVTSSTEGDLSLENKLPRFITEPDLLIFKQLTEENLRLEQELRELHAKNSLLVDQTIRNVENFQLQNQPRSLSHDISGEATLDVILKETKHKRSAPVKINKRKRKARSLQSIGSLARRLRPKKKKKLAASINSCKTSDDETFVDVCNSDCPIQTQAEIRFGDSESNGQVDVSDSDVALFQSEQKVDPLKRCRICVINLSQPSGNIAVEGPINGEKSTALHNHSVVNIQPGTTVPLHSVPNPIKRRSNRLRLVEAKSTICTETITL